MKKYKIGFLCGFFDILHDGHIDVLRKAKDYCDFLIVARIGGDEFMRTRKGREAVLSYDQRVEIVSAIRYVDQVVPEPNLDKVAAFHKYHFDVMIAGSDHEFELTYIETVKELKKLGVDTIYIPRLRNMSSTSIRKRIQTISATDFQE